MEGKKIALAFSSIYFLLSLLSLLIGYREVGLIDSPTAWIGILIGPASFLLSVENYLFKEMYFIATLLFLLIVGLIIYRPKNKLLKYIFGITWLASGYLGIGLILELQRI